MDEAVGVKRVYERREKADGLRLLVDRLWPRGLSKARADWDAWRKDLAPSTELRQWYGHDPDRFTEFRRRYAAELRRAEARSAIRDIAQARQKVTLVTATHDLEHSGATVLAGLIVDRRRGRAASGR
ncbi:MAG: DUF488 family protein [Chloroflexota bacterium]|nr:DUF488 family protein [Chloroflexota bacterium]